MKTTKRSIKEEMLDYVQGQKRFADNLLVAYTKYKDEKYKGQDYEDCTFDDEIKGRVVHVEDMIDRIKKICSDDISDEDKEKEKQAYFVDEEERAKTLKSFGAILSMADQKGVLSAQDLKTKLQFRVGLEYFKNVTKQYRDGLIVEFSILQASMESGTKKGIERQ